MAEFSLWLLSSIYLHEDNESCFLLSSEMQRGFYSPVLLGLVEHQRRRLAPAGAGPLLLLPLCPKQGAIQPAQTEQQNICVLETQPNLVF